MVSYFVVLGLVMLFLYVDKSENKNFKLYNFSILLSMLFLVLFAGFRDISVGTDTGNYVRMFTDFNLKTMSVFEIEYTTEKGYLLLEKIALEISKDYWSILTLIAAICVFCNFFVINKLSQNVRISIFVYISLAVYVIFFNAARQGLAVSISTISLIFIIRKKFLSFIFCILIASFFHRTVLILFPFYFILRIPFNFKNAILFFIIGVVGFYSFSKIISVFDLEVETRYAVYENRGATGGVLLSLFFILLVVVFIKFRKSIKLSNIQQYDVYLNLCLFTSIVYLVVLFTGSDVNFIRITNYFSIGFVLIWPIIFKDLKLFRQSYIKLIFVVVHLIFFAVYLIKMANLVPYLFNTNII